MAFHREYAAIEPARAELDRSPGAVLLEFGAPWCPICRAAQPPIASALEEHAEVRHVKVEDGKGRPLGRSFGVKLWPTLIALRDGREIGRAVRPQNRQVIAKLLQDLAASQS